MKKGEPIGGRIFTPPFILCFILAVIAAYFLVKRFMFGLGAVTNMSDGYPWGIWIVCDVVIGTALGCGGYALALIIYLFNKGDYHPLIRPALLASVMGYSLAGFSVFIDIGRYWQMYNIFLPWHANPRSVLMEVALCIAIYSLVLWIEFSPVLFQAFNLDSLNKKVSKVMFVFIALGILLPTMHQSSLGSLMIIAGKKFSPLWWSPFLPLLFLTSAILMGYGFVVFESGITTLRHKTPDEGRLLARVSALFPWPKNSVPEMTQVKNRLKALVDSGQLGVFASGYWGHPAMKLSPEVNLLAAAHYLQALDYQRNINKVVAILGSKTPTSRTWPWAAWPTPSTRTANPP